jgi:hypothetical protein
MESELFRCTGEDPVPDQSPDDKNVSLNLPKTKSVLNYKNLPLLSVFLFIRLKPEQWSRQSRLGKHVPVAKNRKTTEKLLNAVFSVRFATSKTLQIFLFLKLHKIISGSVILAA